MSDHEIKAAMRTIARINGLPLSEERIEVALPAYKEYLAAMARIEAVELPLEAEPFPVVALRPDGER